MTFKVGDIITANAFGLAEFKLVHQHSEYIFDFEVETEDGVYQKGVKFLKCHIQSYSYRKVRVSKNKGHPVTSIFK